MISLDKLKIFFTENNISLQETRKISEEEKNLMRAQACKHGYAFAQFIENSFWNNELQTNFSSWEDLYENYACFMIGFNRTLDN